VKTKIVFSFLSFLVVLAVLLAGCGTKTTATVTATSTATTTAVSTATTTAVSTATTTATTKTGIIKVGLFNVFQAANGLWGVASLDVSRMQADEVNKAGGLLVGDTRYTIEVIPYETHNNPSEALSQFQKALNQDKINFPIGGATPGDLAYLPLIKENKMVYVNATFSAKEMSVYPNIYNIYITPDFLSINFFQQLTKLEPTWKSFARITQNVLYDEQQTAVKDKDAMKALGLNLVGETIVEVGVTDWSAPVAKVMAMKPDCILIGNMNGQIADIVRACRDAGWKGGLCSTYPAESVDALLKQLKGQESYLERYYEMELNWYPATAEMTAFQKAYESYAGHEYYVNAASHWWEMAVLIRALPIAGTISDADKISKAIESLKIVCPYAPGNLECTFGGKQTYGYNMQLSVPVAMAGVLNINGVMTPKTVWSGVLVAP
jgi:branched-chain amino acid transport system substrate-binding protein